MVAEQCRPTSATLEPVWFVYVELPDRDLESVRAAVEAAENKVRQWRQTGMLPFPEFEAGQRGELTDTLPYPPEGSPHAVTRRAS